jgi:hypothetical protein
MGGAGIAMKNLFRIISYDFRFSFRQNHAKWLFAVIIQSLLCIRSFGEVSLYSCSYDLLSELLPVMGGAREYVLSADSSFELPAYWFLFHIYLSFLIGFYPASELYLGNGQTLIRACSGKIWIVSKIISVFLNITLYYGCFLFLMLIGNWIYDGEIIPKNGIIGLGGIPIFSKSVLELFVAFILLPLLVSVALGVIQILISLFFEPVLSFMAVVGYLIASVFWMNPLLIGNFSMLYRQDWISGKSTIDVITGVVWCLVLTAIALILGVIMFQRKDILPTE